MPEKIIDRPINDIIAESFLDYAREVIENRALPDVRDGLKPVQRRILYCMHELGLEPDKPHKKSARIVGEVLGKFHPHGDAAVYGALVNMAQPFNKRYILVDGQGNFGTVDDPPAAMRYTEARLSPFAIEMLRDLEKDTVDWQNNFDDTLKEPVVLPSMFPNLIVNGTMGIAVGIASSIPPHNLAEVIDGICAYISNPDISVKELMQYIKGPDFPTGGIVSPEGLLKCYESGTGSIKIRSRVSIEELPDDRKQLVISELPYQVSKSSLLNKIAKYIESRKVDDVVEIRDESDQSGTRIVIEMDCGGNAEQLLDELFKKTELEASFSYNLVALVDGKPKTLSLKDMIAEFVKHKKEVVRRKTEYDLKKARAREHILEGLIMAVSIIDDIIASIKKSRNPKEAKSNLMQDYGFSEEQAQAILDMKLQRLTALEVKTLQDELKEVRKIISVLGKILSSEENILKEVKKRLLEIKAKYPDERKTLIQEFDKVEIKTLVEKFTLQISENGKIRKLSENYSGDRGVVLKTDSAKTILFFDEKGYVQKHAGNALPQSTENSVVGLCNEDDYSDADSVVFITSDGMIKKTSFAEYKSTTKNSIAIKLGRGAKVVKVFFEKDPSDIVLLTKKGFVIRFSDEDVRQVGRIAAGVRAIKLEEGDEVIGATTVQSDKKNGSIKIQTGQGEVVVPLDKVKKQNRGGKGVRILKARA